MTDILLERMAKLDTCVLSDALDRHGLQGTLSGFRPVAAQRPFAGRAITVDLGPAPTHRTVEPSRHLGTAAVDAAGTDHVIVVAHHGEHTVAGWGGILSQGSVRNGVAGVVVDGAVRDVDQTRDLGLGIHATAVTPRSARGRVVERSWGRPIEIQSLIVAPDDLIRADGSGVVIVPRKVATVVLAAAEELTKKEHDMVAAVRAQMPMAEVMGRAYEHSLDRTSATTAQPQIQSRTGLQ